MKRVKKSKGMTLIELIVALAIAAIAYQIIYSIFFAGNTFYVKGKDSGMAQQDARIASIYLFNELKFASRLAESPLSGRYFAIYAKDNGDGTKSIQKIEYKDENIVSQSNLITGRWTRIELKDKGGIIEGIILSEVNGEPYYDLPVSIPLENMEYESGIDLVLSNENKLYYALAKDTYIKSTPAPGTEPGTSAEPSSSPDISPEPEIGYPQWDPGKTYDKGAIVSYNGKNYLRKVDWGGNPVPGTNYQVWHEYTDHWVSENIYNKDDMVFHEAIWYKAKWYTQNQEPGKTNAWQGISEYWLPFNDYSAGDIVIHNGVTYKAKWNNTGNEPGKSNSAWEKVQ